ncbi:hypothetical protein D9M69_639860 [compost metagenome]
MLMDPPTRVWSRPVTLASFSAMIRAMVASEPGRSSSIMRTVMYRPAAERPRWITLSISMGSMFPPESTTAVVPGFSILPSMRAATPTAPAGSTTILARSSRKIRARARESSLTVTTSSTSSRMMLNGSWPGRPTAMPSAMVETFFSGTRASAASDGG